MSDDTHYQSGIAEALMAEDDTVAAPSVSVKRAAQAADRHEWGKRFVDVALTLVLATVFSPVILFCFLALSMSRSPVIFSQLRVGRGGKMFRVYKFRTMIPNAQQVLEQLLAENHVMREEYERDHKLRNDPRITRLGRFLRRTSLDELPQLWNVLKGEMSLVGPRPVEYFEMRRYGRFARYYYAQKPGLTGLWQTSGRNNVSYRRRVAMDAYYSRRRSLWMDCVILFDTIAVVVFGRGAY